MGALTVKQRAANQVATVVNSSGMDVATQAGASVVGAAARGAMRGSGFGERGGVDLPAALGLAALGLGMVQGGKTAKARRRRAGFVGAGTGLALPLVSEEAEKAASDYFSE